jgi:transposase
VGEGTGAMSDNPRKFVVKVTRAGWFNFEGFGRPFEGWHDDGFGQRWWTAGRAFTWRGAYRKALRQGREHAPETGEGA